MGQVGRKYDVTECPGTRVMWCSGRHVSVPAYSHGLLGALGMFLTYMTFSQVWMASEAS